jgi:hypothetical protein
MISAGERPQTYAYAATGTGKKKLYDIIIRKV